MTTIIALKSKNSVWMASDMQVTSGHLKLPLKYPKILSVGNNILIAGTGSLGNAQQVLKLVVKDLNIRSIMVDNPLFNFNPSELAEEIAKLNWQLPFYYKDYKSYAYLIVGQDLDTRELQIFSVDDDGSKIEVPEYWADGSGRELALSIISQTYNKEADDETIASCLLQAVTSATQNDIYSGMAIQVYQLNKDGLLKSWDFSKEQNSKEDKVEKEVLTAQKKEAK